MNTHVRIHERIILPVDAGFLRRFAESQRTHRFDLFLSLVRRHVVARPANRRRPCGLRQPRRRRLASQARDRRLAGGAILARWARARGTIEIAARAPLDFRGARCLGTLYLTNSRVDRHQHTIPRVRLRAFLAGLVPQRFGGGVGVCDRSVPWAARLWTRGSHCCTMMAIAAESDVAAFRFDVPHELQELPEIQEHQKPNFWGAWTSSDYQGSWLMMSRILAVHAVGGRRRFAVSRCALRHCGCARRLEPGSHCRSDDSGTMLAAANAGGGPRSS